MKLIIHILAISLTLTANSQTLRTRTDKVSVNFSDEKEPHDSSFPKITWKSPLRETIFQQAGKIVLKFDVISKSQIRKIKINLVRRDQDVQQMISSKEIEPRESQRFSLEVEQSLLLSDGVNEVEVIAENNEGISGFSYRYFHVGETALADAAKLKRTDRALLIVTDKYDHWPALANPVRDGRSLSKELENTFGFQVEVLENPSQDVIWSKIRSYAEKKYDPLDQLLIFFAGHGHFDETFKEGYFVTRESLPNDAGNTSYISHNRLRSNINSIPCDHIFLVMDACFSGTFDEAVASARNVTDVYNEVSQSEFITRKLAYKTRRYLTSGGKEYVSDGVPGHHSPFAAKLLLALETKGGDDGVLTLGELMSIVEKTNPEPRFGKFGDDAPGSEFVFVVKQ